MDGIAVLIISLFMITFAPPVIFLIIGLVKYNKSRDAAKIFFILGATWLIIGGGICLSLMSQ